MTLKGLDAWHRREAEGLLRSAQSEDRGSAYDVLATKGAKESRDRVASCSCGSFGVNRRAMTIQAANRQKPIARFDGRLKS